MTVAETQPGEGPDGGLRVLTWNLWWRFGDWQRRSEAIAAVLAAARPDL